MINMTNIVVTSEKINQSIACSCSFTYSLKYALAVSVHVLANKKEQANTKVRRNASKRLSALITSIINSKEKYYNFRSKI